MEHNSRVAENEFLLSRYAIYESIADPNDHAQNERRDNKIKNVCSFSFQEFGKTLVSLLIIGFSIIACVQRYKNPKLHHTNTLHPVENDNCSLANSSDDAIHFVANKTIYMFGDSTIITYQYPQLCKALSAVQTELNETFTTCYSSKYNLTIVSTLDYSSWDKPIFDQTDFIEWTSKITNTEPDVIYFNGGLHDLHLMPYRSWNEVGNGYKNWKNAEDIVGKFVKRIKHQTNALIVFMTAHSICDRKFNDDYKIAFDDIAKNETLISQNCAKWLVNAYSLTLWDATHECIDGVFTRNGIKKLNARILNVLPKEVRVVNAFKITDSQCNHTRDARHYDSFIINKELKELFRVIR